MPDMLTVAGIPALILEDTAFRDEDERRGETVRMFAGNLGSTERNGKASYRGQVLFQTEAAEATLRAACPLGNSLSVGGEMIDNGPITANVAIGQSQFFEHEVSGVPTLYKIADIRIREI